MGYQQDYIAWGILGTPERMEKFGRLMEKAKAAAVTPMEIKRVGLWEKSVWDRMKNAQKDYLQSGDEAKRVQPPEGEKLSPEYWGEWAFRKDEDNLGVEGKWYVDFDDGPDWTPVKVPAFLSETTVGEYLGYGWYRTTFEIPGEHRGKPVMLYFGAVDSQAWVYINGKYAGEHSKESEGATSGSLWDKPFIIEMTPDKLSSSGDNFLFVRNHAARGQMGIWQNVDLYFIQYSE